MSGKKERGFFVCPRWNELADTPHATASPAASERAHGSARIMAAIRDGQPVAPPTLRKALLAVRQRSGKVFDVDACIVDQRTARPR